MHFLKQAIWGNIWKHTVEESPTNATNVTTAPQIDVISLDIWKTTQEKSQTSKEKFCDLVHIQSVIELFGKQVNNALNVH